MLLRSVTIILLLIVLDSIIFKINGVIKIVTLNFKYYLNLKYPITLYPDVDGGYVAEIKDLPGYLTQGENLEETINNIDEARELWLETAYESNDEIPMPKL
ncbi:MAG: type II toxin-antitoxin system HicB family antitoxin [Waterburya sp.]